MTVSAPILQLHDIRKNFGGITAIESFSLEVFPGEIVALVGDNGAGKSTLVKIVSGVHPPSSGTIVIEGKPVTMSNATMGRAHGIEVVYQDLALADQQTVYMNMFLGREPLNRLGLLDRRRMIDETEKLVKELDVRIPSAHATIRDLSGGQRQGVAIARATHWASKLILLDEPTAALGVAETARVEAIVQSLKQRNVGILIISHSLDQVFKLSDRICVLRRGKQIGIRETAKTDKNEIIAMITGLQQQ
ncbi:ATP-binding cassette domain-containing protein [Mesorhizobium sp. M0761]|jgi:ABC-type sugar transport system ATPase subunit|uniref:ATP-binding cassette domain-containing protein n=1 Tax=unclassified Mesorhizobium TaxID=325217 RepID=UPI0003CDF00D|nr:MULTISPECIES: ATP-binding cassette domain-containing protein [unclassified Mesorhizobium]ESW91842.1 sugar ABC transporter ATP-binding protein [Mesorhizobium sp. LSJC269B00]ESX04401.1 sugar ABC transporter ATP-binding protein [Mesorhizobium sp. LSJC268A00]ESX14756.1 sugar ABC transporter ATP-binding protein [Mesorhizobium sp. LSJC265A00]ESX20109.1 sugar ABC transporter ATP-binding protein [Mesorhizobium sp. LSJC255A00]ESX52436.1 sugar ABC transporter ATP-binding protein [Mesorhizobium sp. LS